MNLFSVTPPANGAEYGLLRWNQNAPVGVAPSLAPWVSSIEYGTYVAERVLTEVGVRWFDMRIQGKRHGLDFPVNRRNVLLTPHPETIE